MRSTLAIAALFVASSAQAQLENPDIHSGFPSWQYCHEDFVEYNAAGSAVSTSGDMFFNSSTTAALAEATPVAMSNGVLAAGNTSQNLTAAGDAGVRTQPNYMSMGIGRVEFIFAGREVTVSTAGDTFTERIGILDSDTAPADGVYFRYTHGTNSGEWEAVAIATSGGAETTVDTNVVYTAGTSRIWEISVNADSSEALYYIDNVLVATISTAADIPNGTEYTGLGWTANKTAHTGTVISMTMDYIAGKITFTTPRC
jgi:hypothetical protein